MGGTVDSGLVISDNQADENEYENQEVVGTNLKGNQYVWIEVPKTEAVYQTAKLNIVEDNNGEFTDAQYTAIENDLQAYTSIYRNGTNFTDEYDASVVEAATGLTSTEYADLKKKMLQSVYQNGGFWIGRYEVGIEENTIRSFGTDTATEHPVTGQTPVVKANKYPYNWVRTNQAQALARSINSGNYTSSLMFGVQRDLILKYLETKGISISDLNMDSTEWGNYKNNTYNINQANAEQSRDSGATWSQAQNKTAEENILLTTGASEEFNKMNIYDLAGNVWELTLEYTANSNLPCTSRGGNFTVKGLNYLASHRYSRNMLNSFNGVGFRITLF